MKSSEEKSKQQKYYETHKSEILAKKTKKNSKEYEELKERKILNEYVKLHKEEIKEMKRQRKEEREKAYNTFYFQKNKEKILEKRKEN